MRWRSWIEYCEWCESEPALSLLNEPIEPEQTAAQRAIRRWKMTEGEGEKERE